MLESQIVPLSEVHTGQRITEIDTPEGPFYEVVRETDKSLWIGVDGVEVRFGKSPRAGVRVAV